MLKSMLCPKGMTYASVSGPKICSVLAGGSQFGMFGEGGELNIGFLTHVDNILLFHRLFFIFA